eukprot:1826915-Rhodomonas_salina.1
MGWYLSASFRATAVSSSACTPACTRHVLTFRHVTWRDHAPRQTCLPHSLFQEHGVRRLISRRGGVLVTCRDH